MLIVTGMDNLLRNNLTDFRFLFFVPIIICSVGLSAFQFMDFQSHCIVVNRTMALKSGSAFKVQSFNDKK